MPETIIKPGDIEYQPLRGYIQKGQRRLYLSPFEERLMWVLYHSTHEQSMQDLQDKLTLPNEPRKNTNATSRLISRFRNDRQRENSKLSRLVINKVDKHDNKGWYRIKNRRRIHFIMPTEYHNLGKNYNHIASDQYETKDTSIIIPVFNTVFIPQLRTVVGISHNEMEVLTILASCERKKGLRAIEIQFGLETKYDHKVTRTQVYSIIERLRATIPSIRKEDHKYKLNTDQLSITIPIPITKQSPT
jgi:hypothetical protein